MGEHIVSSVWYVSGAGGFCTFTQGLPGSKNRYGFLRQHFFEPVCTGHTAFCVPKGLLSPQLINGHVPQNFRIMLVDHLIIEELFLHP